MLIDVAVRRAKGANMRCLTREFSMLGTSPWGYREGKGYYRQVFLDLRYKHIKQMDNPKTPLESILGFRGVGDRLIEGTVLNALGEICQNDANVSATRWRAGQGIAAWDTANLLGARNPMAQDRHNRELML